MPDSPHDRFDLSRFIDAQSDAYPKALSEIRRGRKQSHWMWFIFPQFRGLGMSETAKHYAIRSTDEAAAFLAHPVLGGRYRECVAALQDLDLTDPEQVFITVDALKLKSSLTLFHAVGPGALFQAALDRWYNGQLDQWTIALIDA